MPKKLKLSLEDLKIQSFVTGLDDEILRRMNGGSDDEKSHVDSECCPTPLTVCGMTNNPCYTNCSPPPENC